MIDGRQQGAGNVSLWWGFCEGLPGGHATVTSAGHASQIGMQI